MTHLILRSRISDEKAFEMQVQFHAEHLKKHREHLVSGGDYYPPDKPHPDIDAAVRRPDLVPDYKLVDFIPVQHGDINALNLRKQELWHQISQMESEAVNYLLPNVKWRLAGLKHAIASNKNPDDRTPEDNDLISEHQDRLKLHQQIQLYYAQLQSDVEDLTFDSVNDFVLRPIQLASR